MVVALIVDGDASKSTRRRKQPSCMVGPVRSLGGSDSRVVGGGFSWLGWAGLAACATLCLCVWTPVGLLLWRGRGVVLVPAT